MAPRNRARNKDDYIYLINQALDEVFDLQAAIEYDEEYMGDASILIGPLTAGLQQLLADVKGDNYEFKTGNHLDFLQILKGHDERAIPFWSLLKLLLNTHTQGYQD